MRFKKYNELNTEQRLLLWENDLTESQKSALTQNGASEPQKGVGLFVAGNKVYNINNEIQEPWLDLFAGGN